MNKYTADLFRYYVDPILLIISVRLALKGMYTV